MCALHAILRLSTVHESGVFFFYLLHNYMYNCCVDCRHTVVSLKIRQGKFGVLNFHDEILKYK